MPWIGRFPKFATKINKNSDFFISCHENSTDEYWMLTFWFLNTGYMTGWAQKPVKMSKIGKSKIQVLIKVGYYLLDLKVSDLNSYVLSHGWNPNYIQHFRILQWKKNMSSKCKTFAREISKLWFLSLNCHFDQKSQNNN